MFKSFAQYWEDYQNIMLEAKLPANVKKVLKPYEGKVADFDELPKEAQDSLEKMHDHETLQMDVTRYLRDAYVKERYKKEEVYDEAWKKRVKSVYKTIDELKRYDDMYGILKYANASAKKHGKPTWKTLEDFWKANPMLTGSVDPKDFGVIFKEDVFEESVEIGKGFYVNKVGMDSNGNKSVWVSKGSNKSFKIQTNGNVPTAHSHASNVNWFADKENPKVKKAIEELMKVIPTMNKKYSTEDVFTEGRDYETKPRTFSELDGKYRTLKLTGASYGFVPESLLEKSVKQVYDHLIKKGHKVAFFQGNKGNGEPVLELRYHPPQKGKGNLFAEFD